MKQPDVDNANTGAPILPGTETQFLRYYLLSVPDNVNIDEYVSPDARLYFEIEYYKIGYVRKKYKLQYELVITPMGTTYRVLYGKIYVN